MEKITSPKYTAQVCFGLLKGYTKELINIPLIENKLVQLQEHLIKEKNIYLSANIWESNIVLSGQNEPHINIRFINYPRFPLLKEIFRKSVEEITIALMYAFEQNRVVIEYEDEMLMLQDSNKVDSAILLHE